MITDGYLRLSSSQAINLNATSDLSTYSVDLSVPDGTGGVAGQDNGYRDLGEGKELFAVFTIVEAVSAGTSVTFDVVGADNAALSTNLITIASSSAVTRASGDLALGKQIVVALPPKIGSLGKAYIGAKYTVAGDASGGTGKVTADIVEAIQDGKKFYKSGFTSAA